MFNQLINRAFGNKKRKYRYEIEADNGGYEILLHYPVSQNFFMQAWYAMKKRVGKLSGHKIPDRFDIPDRLLGALGKTGKNAVKQIVKQAQKEKPGFRIASQLITRAWIEKKGREYVLTLEITGACEGD